MRNDVGHNNKNAAVSSVGVSRSKGIESISRTAYRCFVRCPHHAYISWRWVLPDVCMRERMHSSPGVAVRRSLLLWKPDAMYGQYPSL